MVGRHHAAGFGRRKPSPIDLPCGRHRKAIQRDISSGDHVLGEARPGEFAQLSRRRRSSVASQEVRDDARLARCVFAHHDDRVGHRWVLCQRGLDFSQLDSESAKLDLVVAPAQELDIAVGQIARKIARCIHPRIGLIRMRIGDEALGRQLWTSKVAARDPMATDEDFAGEPHRHRRTVRVENQYARVGQRASDGNHVPPIRRIADPERRVHGGLGRPVTVDQFGSRLPVEAMYKFAGKDLASREDPAQTFQVRESRVLRRSHPAGWGPLAGWSPRAAKRTRPVP